MNKVTSLIVGVLATVALIVGVVAYNKTPSVLVGAKGEQGPRGEQGPAGRDGKDGVTKVVTQVVEKPASQTLGAVSTLDGIFYPYVKIADSREYYWNTAFSATSSVVCSIQNPYKATSTIPRVSVIGTVNSFGAHLLDISTSSTAFGSSSPAFVKAFNTGTGQFNINWFANSTTTNTILIGAKAGSLNSVSDVILGPTEYLTVRIATSSPGTFGTYNSGRCGARILPL